MWGMVHSAHSTAPLKRSIVVSRSRDLCPGPAGLAADGGQIRQMLHNLIRNASEAVETGQSPKIRIRSRQVERDGTPWLELKIFDHGPGFPDAVLENPFEPYITSKHNGSGLGLAICRKIVADHDGRISIENLDEGGACARILLPLKADQAQDAGHRVIG